MLAKLYPVSYPRFPTNSISSKRVHMKCLVLPWRPESCQVSHKKHWFYRFVIETLYLTLFVYLHLFCEILDFRNLFIDLIHILFMLFLLLWSCFSKPKVAGFHPSY